MEVLLTGLALVAALAVAIVAGLFLKTKRKLTAAQAEIAGLKSVLSRLEIVKSELHACRAQILEAEKAKSVLEAECKSLPALRKERDDTNEKLLLIIAENSRLQTSLGERDRAHQRELEQLNVLREDVISKFKVLAADSLRENQTTFLGLAKQVFDGHKQGADADLEARQNAVSALIQPVVTMLSEYQVKISELGNLQHSAYGSLTAELKQVIDTQNGVRQETAKLVNALKASPKTRGRWGENTLRNVIELSGLSGHCDFVTEETIRDESGLFRPDMIISLPGGRSLAVDAKTSLNAYLDAVDATDELDRERLMHAHAAQLRNHAKQLGSKAYWDKLTNTPDFVVMFVPGENFYSAAVERDSQLFEDAIANRVLIATPATLIAIAKAVAYGWRQEKIAENTRTVHVLGRELYRRLTTMGQHVQELGSRLGGAVKAYNSFVGSLESSVMPQARKFNELEVEGTATPIQILQAIEQEARPLTPGRDISLPPVSAA